jgi:PAS domain S-box-containing protein
LLVSEFCRAHLDEIVARWEAVVRNAPGLEKGRNLPTPVLRDHLPEVLESLADWLDHNRPEDASPYWSLAVMHGRQRLALGFDLRQVVREYGELRRSIVLLMLERGVAPPAAELLRLDAAMDAALGEATEEYHEARASILEENERRYRLAIESARLGTWDLNPTTGELRTDARWHELFGVPAGTPLNYTLFLEHVHPEDRPRVDAAVKDVLARRSDRYDIEFRTQLPGATNDRRWVHSMGRAYFDESGRPLRFVGTVLDVTDRRLVEAERDLLLGVLGHDLRDPLGAIKMAAELLVRRTDAEPAVLRTGARIVSIVDRMARLIGQLLEYIRGRSGHLALERRWVDLREVCAQVIAETELLHPGRQVALTVTGGEPLGLWDADRIARLVGNLVGNAVQHGDPEGPVTVAVHAGAEEVTIEVHNEGAPIPGALLPHIFDPFRRATGRVGGLGLGLYISRQIAVAHGGRMEVRSDEGGTTFRVTLPRQQS